MANAFSLTWSVAKSIARCARNRCQNDDGTWLTNICGVRRQIRTLLPVFRRSSVRRSYQLVINSNRRDRVTITNASELN